MWSQLKLRCVRFFLETKKVFSSSPPLLGLCFLLCWHNKPMKFEYFPSDESTEQAQLQRRDDVNPGGRYRQLLYPVMAYYRSVRWNWRSYINPSTRARIFKCEGFTLFIRVENLHHTSFGSVQGLNNDIFCVSIRLKFLFVEAKLDFLARKTVQRFAAIDRKVAAFL